MPAHVLDPLDVRLFGDGRDPDDPDDPDGSAGVREPRRPRPLGPISGAGARPEPVPFVALTLTDARS